MLGCASLLEPEVVAPAIGTARWTHLSGYTLLGGGSPLKGLAAGGLGRKVGRIWWLDETAVRS